MHLIRRDLRADELAALEPQFPGLAARVPAHQALAAGDPASAV